MKKYLIDGYDLLSMLEGGTKNLALDCERINELNVFPVPDGDTGTNMKVTMEGGYQALKEHPESNISSAAALVARAMVLSARGNSGVILSQFFKGLSLGLGSLSQATIKDFIEALQAGTKRAYKVVSNPTEGTILTVMKEAGLAVEQNYTEEESLEEVLDCYLNALKDTLAHTPELLPVLKEAGVIDSGGAGFERIIDGMLKEIRGIEIEYQENSIQQSASKGSFNADSELTYGYCTEFILQLQNKKVDVQNFDLEQINSFLKTIGNSIVSFKDEDIIKVHVHTFDPGVVLTECRKYGEFISVKIENMNIEHSKKDNIVSNVPPKKHQKYAVVTVANGEGLQGAFKNMGADVVISGGQTMNTSTDDFIQAFNQLNADNILVFPNNSNIVMAAKMAADLYQNATVTVIPTKSVVEGYSAISMLNFESDDLKTILAGIKESIQNIKTLEVTYSIRDMEWQGVSIKKNDFICLYEGKIISSHKDRITAVQEAFEKIDQLADVEVMTMIYGRDISLEECNQLSSYAQSLNDYLETFCVKGDQDIYSYIIGLE